MILNVTDKTLSQIKNPTLRSYAGIYVSIYQDFMQQIAQTGVKIDSQDYLYEVKEKVEALNRQGASIRNNGKSIHFGSISPACVACQTGVGSSTFFISLQCHRDCYYCFNPNQENYEYFQEHTRDVIGELEQIKKQGQHLRHLALTGGEPLLFKEKAVEFFKYAQSNFPETYTRLYTCGDHVDSEILSALKDAGLQEIRFSIRMHDFAKGQRSIYERIALAKKYISYVMVEMPVLPGTLDEMKEILVELDRLGLFSINLLELCYPLANAETYNEKSFMVKHRPFQVLYDYWYAGGVPVSGSELVCLDLLQFALDAKLSMGVHYCSVENKQTGQIFKQNSVRIAPPFAYFSKRDYFLKTAKVFGDDVGPVREFFERKKDMDFQIDTEHDFLEFPVINIRSLKDLDVEVGISSNVLENRNGEMVIRELKLDVAIPKKFQLSKDI